MVESSSSLKTPCLRSTQAGSKQLIVDGEPFLILGGELQNSSFSSVEYMNDVWSGLKAANLNTVFASVSWEQVEPEEGVFDFGALDQLIEDARLYGLRLVLLWFGSFKNGMSTYVPTWVKLDASRFPRAMVGDGNTGFKLADTLSSFGLESCQADAKAFKTLMQHLKEIDEQHATVIMVQVENEVGLLGASRDRCKSARQAFESPLPDDMLDFLRSDWPSMQESFRSVFHNLQPQVEKEDLTWASLLCDEASRDELFMAFYYAKYVETVAAAGKEAYALPMYTNVWQNYGDDDRDETASAVAAGGNVPGAYPSGGAVAHILDVWQTFSPSLDLIAPDIYLNDYAKVCAKYRHRGQPLLIPEQRRDEYGARRIWLAFGSYQCIGTAPFGIDTLDPQANPITAHYALLAKVSQRVLRAQSTRGSSIGFFFDELLPDGNHPSMPVSATFGSWSLLMERSHVFGRPSPGCGIVIDLGCENFLLVGWGFQVTFTSTNPKAKLTGILRFEEKDIDDVKSGEMRTVRLLNGDETRSGRCAVMPSQDPDYGGFPISITIPARTGIAMCQPYALYTE